MASDPPRSEVFERADLFAVLEDIQAAAERYAVQHVKPGIDLQLRVRLKLTSTEATIAEWWLEGADP